MSFLLPHYLTFLLLFTSYYFLLFFSHLFSFSFSTFFHSFFTILSFLLFLSHLISFILFFFDLFSLPSFFPPPLPFLVFLFFDLFSLPSFFPPPPPLSCPFIFLPSFLLSHSFLPSFSYYKIAYWIIHITPSHTFLCFIHMWEYINSPVCIHFTAKPP